MSDYSRFVVHVKRSLYVWPLLFGRLDILMTYGLMVADDAVLPLSRLVRIVYALSILYCSC